MNFKKSKMERMYNFEVEEGLLLEFNNLFAKILITKGVAGKVVITAIGEDSQLDDLLIEQVNGKKIRLGLKTKDRNVASSSFSCISGNISNSVVITNGNISIGNNQTIINGKVKKLIVINMTVPEGCDLDVSGVKEFQALGLGGRLWADLSGQSELEIEKVSNPKVDCSGQSSAKIFGASGTAKIDVSGQSSAYLAGNLEEIKISVSGQSRADIFAYCQEIGADASGMSEIAFQGKCSGRSRARATGMSQIRGI